MKRDTRMPDEAGMTDRETIIKGLEWWVKHQEDEVLPLAYSAVVETLKVLKEQDELLHKKQNDIDRLCNEISEWKHKFHDTLKEQEAVEPTLKREGRNKYYSYYVCPRCGDEVVYEQNYCSECGVRFLWEGR